MFDEVNMSPLHLGCTSLAIRFFLSPLTHLFYHPSSAYTLLSPRSSNSLSSSPSLRVLSRLEGEPRTVGRQKLPFLGLPRHPPGAVAAFAAAPHRLADPPAQPTLCFNLRCIAFPVYKGEFQLKVPL